MTKRIGPILALLLTVGTLTAQTPIDPLWAAAVEVYVNNRRWSPGRMIIVSQEVDRKGNVKNEELTEVEIALNGDGETVSRIVRVVKNGTDVTGERPSGGNAPGGGRPGGEMPNPLDPAHAEQVSARPLGERKVIDGRVCVGFGYEMTTGRNDGYTGTVWISEDGGVPIAMTAVPDPMPVFVDSFSLEFYFTDDPRSWYAERALMQGSATILLLKKSFRAVMSFEDYFIKP